MATRTLPNVSGDGRYISEADKRRNSDGMVGCKDVCDARGKEVVVPVKIDTIEAMSAEEFDRLRRARSGRGADPAMAELLDRLEALPPFESPVSSAELIRADRGE